MTANGFVEIMKAYVFFYPLIMSIAWIIGGIFFYWRREKGHSKEPPKLKEHPRVSVLIPAHNEERDLRDAVTSIYSNCYENLDVIVIDDASTDGTQDVIERLMVEYPTLRVVRLTRNMGKANALNAALPMTRGEIIVTLDADSMLDEHAIEWAVWHFVNFPRVGAVTGNPRVRNRTTLLAKIQTAEYASVISLIKRTQRLVGKLMTVSGVVAAWRKTAIVGAGGWDPRSVTDDIDMTWRLETRFWDIRYEPNMLCWMLVPETLRGIWRQRLRWAQGGVEVIRMHKGVWTDWRERRIWPIYVEYVMGILWSYAFLAYLLLWGMSQLTGVGREIVGNPFWGWNGAVIACVCLLQFAISVLLDMRYDEDLWKVIFWVVWYPVVYWAFNAMAAAVSFPKGLLRSMEQPATWVSPDRGVR